MKTRTKKNSTILRSNLNKKLIQLQRIIFDLSSSSENLGFQRNFLHTYFNPKIDNAINTYREHIGKMQKVSLGDYDFIVERTDLFYKRKMKNLLKNIIETTTSLKKQANDEIDKLDKEKLSAIEYLANLQIQLSKSDEALNKMVKEITTDLTKEAKAAENRGHKNLLEEIEKFNLRDEKIVADSDVHCKKLKEDHDQLMEKIKNGYSLPLYNFQAMKSKVNDAKREEQDARNKLRSMSNYTKETMSQYKNKINQIVKEMKALMLKNYDELSYLRKCFDSEKTSLDDQTLNLVEKLTALKEKLSNESKEKADLLVLMKERNMKVIEDKKNNSKYNNDSTESQISYLKKSLRDNRQTIAISFKEKQDKIKQENEKINEMIVLQEKSTVEMNTQMISQLMNNKEMHKKEVRSYQMSFLATKEKAAKSNEAEIKSMKEKIKSNNYNKNNEEINLKLALEGLVFDKEKLVSNHTKLINEFDKSEENEIADLEKETKSKISNLQNNIIIMLEKEKLESEKKISDAISFNNKKKVELVNNLQNRYINEIELLNSKGFSKMEYQTLYKAFQEEYQKLMNESKQMVPFESNDDCFENMGRVISDLENELKDHIAMVSSRTKMLLYEWQNRINDENKTISSLQIKSSQSRARGQVIQSMKNQILQIRQEKEDTIAQLNIDLQDLKRASIQQHNLAELSTGEENDQCKINQLKDQLEMLLNIKDKSVQSLLSSCDEKRRNLENEYSFEMGLLNKKIIAVKEATSTQNSFFEEKYTQLINTQQMNQMIFTKAFEDSKRNHKCDVERRKAEFIENEHLLQKKCKEQNFQNTRQYDSNASQEMVELKKQNKYISDQEVYINNFLQERHYYLDELKASLSKSVDELRGKKGIIVRKVGDRPSRPCDIDKIERLEQQLSIKTIQLKNSLHDISEYRNLYISQEKSINKNFGGMPEIGILQMNQKLINNINVV